MRQCLYMWLRLFWGLSHRRPKERHRESRTYRLKFGGIGADHTPYGHSRAILLFVIVQVLETAENTRTVELCAKTIKRFFDYGKRSSVVMEHVQRILDCRYLLIEYAQDGAQRVEQTLELFESRRICGQTGTVEVTLGHQLLESIRSGPRFAVSVIKALVKSNQLAALDLYLWYAWRLHEKLTGPVPASDPDNPIHMIAFTAHRNMWPDRLKDLHEQVVTYWPDCPFSIGTDGLTIRCERAGDRQASTRRSTGRSESTTPGHLSPDRSEPPRWARLIRSTLDPRPSGRETGRQTQSFTSVTSRPPRAPAANPHPLRNAAPRRLAQLYRYLLPLLWSASTTEREEDRPPDARGGNHKRGPPR